MPPHDTAGFGLSFGSGDGGAAGSEVLPREQRSSAKKARHTWMLDAKEDNPKHAEEEADEYEDEDEDSQ